MSTKASGGYVLPCCAGEPGSCAAKGKSRYSETHRPPAAVAEARRKVRRLRRRSFADVIAADIFRLLYFSCCAAVLMASRMRVYVPQRQRLPPIDSSTWVSLGVELLLSRATALMICPL